MKNIAFITAHPDDLEINAGGTVSRFIQQDKKLLSVVCSLPEDEVIRNLRTDEAMNAAKLLGISNIEILGFRDTKIFLSVDKLIRTIDELVKINNIDTIFTHHPGDGHNDHKSTAEIAAAVARKIPNLIYFRPTAPSTNSGIPFNQNLVVSLTEADITAKMNALSCHYSQIEKYGRLDWVQRMHDIAVADSWIYGGSHGYAEVFEISRLKL